MRFPYYKLTLSALLNSLLSSFQPGYHLGVINIPEQIMKDFINNTYYDRYGEYMDEATLTPLWSFIVAAYIVGAVFGAYTTTFFAERFGRKLSLLCINNVIAVVGSLILGLSQPCHSYEMLAVGRIVIGFCSGLSTGLLALYLTECAPNEFRGFVGSFQNMFITITSFISQVVALPQLLGTEELWPYLMALGLVPAVLQLMIFWFFPESPKFLLLKKKNPDAATKALLYFHGPDANIDQIFKEFYEEESLAKHEVGMIEAFRKYEFRAPILMSVVVNVGHIFSGIMVIFSYSTSIFENVGIDVSTAQYASVIMSACNTLGAFISSPIIDRVGRRPLFLLGLMATTLCNTVFLVFSQIGLHNSSANTWTSYICLVAIVIHVTVFNIGPGAIAWFISSEVTPQNARATGASISIVSNWLTSLVVTMIFPIIQTAIGSLVFLVFIVPCSICIIWLWFYMPETKNQPIEEILKRWPPKNPVANKSELNMLEKDPKN